MVRLQNGHDYAETCAPFIVDSNLYWELVLMSLTNQWLHKR